MGINQSKDEDKDHRYENLSEEIRKKLFDSKVRINGEEILLQKAKRIYWHVEAQLEKLSPDIIKKILDGEIVDLDWDLKRRRSLDDEKKPNNRLADRDEYKDDRFCNVVVDRRVPYINAGTQCSPQLKGVKTFASHTERGKKTIRNAMVYFQGVRVKLCDLVYGDEKFYELLSSDDLAIMIKFKNVTFFNPTNIPETNTNEVCFTTKRGVFEEWKSGIDYDSSEYLKGDAASAEVTDDVGGNSGKNSRRAQEGAWGGSGSVGGSSSHLLRSPSGGNGSGGGGGGKDGEEGARSKFEWSSSQKIQEEEGSAPKDEIYELNEVLSVEKLVAKGMDSKIILLEKSDGAGETPTLFAVRDFIQEHFKSLGVTPFIFYLNFKENAEAIAKKLSIIKTDSKLTILERLKTLAFDNENYDKARMDLFEAKYRKGHMAFLWDNTEEVADKELLQEIFKEIYENSEQMIELGCQKNVQWIVSSRTFVKEREKAFGCKSYCFVRLSNQKVLEAFGQKVKAKKDNENCDELQAEINKLSLGVNIKFQKSVTRKSFGSVSVNEDNHYNILKHLHTALNLSNESQKILTRMAIEWTIEHIKEENKFKNELKQLDAVQNTGELTKKEMRSGAFKFDKTLKEYTLLEHFLDFLIVNYLRDAIYFDTNALARQKDESEILCRLKFLIFVIVELPSIRLTLRDFLLTVTDLKMHKCIRKKISDGREYFLGEFKKIPSAAQLSILHCLACDEELYEYFGNHAKKSRQELAEFLENEKKKRT